MWFTSSAEKWGGLIPADGHFSNRSTWKQRSLSWPIFCGVLFKSGWEFLLTASYFKFFLRPSSLTDLCLFLGCPGPDCLDLRDICFKGFHLFKASLGMLWKNIQLQWFGRRNICNMFIHTDSVLYHINKTCSLFPCVTNLYFVYECCLGISLLPSPAFYCPRSLKHEN